MPPAPEVLELFVEACAATWAVLNPEYEIRRLNDSTLPQFLTPQDARARPFLAIETQKHRDA